MVAFLLCCSVVVDMGCYSRSCLLNKARGSSCFEISPPVASPQRSMPSELQAERHAARARARVGTPCTPPAQAPVSASSHWSSPVHGWQLHPLWCHPLRQPTTTLWHARQTSRRHWWIRGARGRRRAIARGGLSQSKCWQRRWMLPRLWRVCLWRVRLWRGRLRGARL